MTIQWFSDSKITIKTTGTIGLLFCLLGFQATLKAEELSLIRAQQLAIAQDPNLKGNDYREEAIRHEEQAAGYWSNPQLSASLQNLPTDGFSLDQEPMTQFKVGVKQQLPRGDVNHLTQQRLAVMARKVVTESEARKAWVKKEVSALWLDWYYASQRLQLLDKEKHLLNQLLDVTESRYAQALGGAQQGDVLQVRLAILTLADKQTQAIQALHEAKAALSQWLGAPLTGVVAPERFEQHSLLTEYQLDTSTFLQLIGESEPFTLLQQHPEAQLLQLQTQVEQKQLAIAREQTKSQWSVEASYGYRQDAQNGASRADFVSLGVQVDLPFFTKPKQEASISSAASKVNALKTDFRLKVNALAAQADVLKARYASLSERKSLYQNGLVEEVAELAQTLLTSYTTDTANFSEVINANIRQIQVEDELLRIQMSEAKTLSSLLYLYLPAWQAASNT